MNIKDISQKEIFRYLGYHNTIPTETIQSVVTDCISELLNCCSMHHTYKIFDCVIQHTKIIIDNHVIIESKNLSKNLNECNQVILFAATLGVQADILLKKYSHIDMSKAVIMHAVAATIIEEYCDQCQIEIEKILAKQKLFLRPRFSPGYGDFNLIHQQDFITLLDCPRKIGLTLTDSFLLAPSKSVTAVMGISKTNKYCPIKGCEACAKTNCIFRRGDDTI